MSVCGSGTGKINIFEIDEKDLKRAEQLDFKPLSDIDNQ